MRTQMMIMLVVGSTALSYLVAVACLMWWLGWAVGLATAAIVSALFIAVYLSVLKPWHMRWGTTDDEVTRPMPGDELIADAPNVTRAITINASQNEIWPWLVQLGYGKAGWYSYDWIDNDFRRSADRVIDGYQHLAPGDKILMMPEMGFVVQSVNEPHAIVSMLEDGSTSWCLALYPGDAHTRLVSRWRSKFEKTSAAFLMNLVTEPGTFIMEQKMLRSIRDRAEA